MFNRFRMKIEKNTIVSLRYKLTDAQNNVIEEPDSPMVYLHGGYEGTFPKIESLLDGQDIGYEATIQLEPSEAFGEYDPELLKIEPRTRFPEPLEVGMQFEGIPDADDESDSVQEPDSDDEPLIYTVTDVADSQVVKMKFKIVIQKVARVLLLECPMMMGMMTMKKSFQGLL